MVFKNSLRTFQCSTRIKCENLVVGSGAGGAVTAWFLSKKGKDVLLVEEGPFVKMKGEDSSVSNYFPSVWRNGGIIPIFGTAKFVFAEGRCLGGSTMLNSGLIHRIPPDIADEWGKQFKITEFSFESMQKHHDVIEKRMNISVVNNSANIAHQMFKEGAEKCKFTGLSVPVAGELKDGFFHKKNMQNTFLKDAVEYGLKIITDCCVDKMICRGSSASEVRCTYTDIKGNKLQLYIEFDRLYLCAGTIHTALLLRRSGFTKSVGENIHFHPTLRVVTEFDRPINAHTYEMPSFQVKEFAPDISMGASVVAPSYLAVGLSANWNSNKGFIERFRNMGIYYVMIRCKAQGSVRNAPFLNSSYIVRYSLNGADLNNLSFGFAKLCELLFAAGAKRLFPSIDGSEPFSDNKMSSQYLTQNLPLSRLNLMTIHSFSSCPIGEDLNRCPVDSFGKVRSLNNVFVNDASLLPSSPGVNPQGPIMAIALRNLEYQFNT
ncbi:MAG: GMC family oxidoreductase [Planctomycetes bacterium]|nr:GMC family oxidoreductase [Planctomycetota bacterium]